MKTLRLLCLQHIEFEGPGALATWATQHNHPLTLQLVNHAFQFPELDTWDMLILLGGPMGVYEEEDYPWMRREKQYIQKSIEANKAVLGICLGAQMIASALGASVYPHTCQEIGWYPLYPTTEANEVELLASFPASAMAFHWHGDTFDLPEGAIPLFRSEACEQQGFLYGSKVVGLQFHWEATESSIEAMLQNSAPLVASPTVMEESEIKKQMFYTEACNRLLFLMLDQLAAQLTSES